MEPLSNEPLPSHLVIEDFDGRGVMIRLPSGLSQEGYQFRFSIQTPSGQPEVWTHWMYVPAAGLETLIAQLQRLAQLGHLATPTGSGSPVQ